MKFTYFAHQVIRYMCRVILFVLGLCCFGCYDNESKTIFCGKIYNPTDSLVTLYFNNQAIDTTRLDSEDFFIFEFDKLPQSGLFYLKNSNNFQYVYLEEGDSLKLTANTYNFEKSTTWEGKGAQINTFMSDMRKLNEQNIPFYKQIHNLSAQEFITKIDSVHYDYLILYEDFLNSTKNLSEKAQKMAWASFFFDVHKQHEMYLFEHNYRNRKHSPTQLPKYFYNFRKEINFNDLELSFYTPYHQYLTHYINNIAYTQNLVFSENRTHDEIVYDFQLKKLNCIDSVFNNKTIKDNMIRAASFWYMLRPKNEYYNQIYIENTQKYIENNLYKDEIEHLYEVVLKFKSGQDIPNLKIVDIDNQNIELKSVINHQKCVVFYFWSATEPNKSIHQRIAKLQNDFPAIRFIGIDTADSYSNWLYRVSDTELIRTEQYHICSYNHSADQSLITYNTNKAMIINKKGKIEQIFVDIFSKELDTILHQIK